MIPAFSGSGRITSVTHMDDEFHRFEDTNPIMSISIVRVCQRLLQSPAERRLIGADDIVDGAIEWFQDRQSRPFYLWLHFSDLNGPLSVKNLQLVKHQTWGYPQTGRLIQRIAHQKDLEKAYISTFQHIDNAINRLLGS